MVIHYEEALYQVYGPFTHCQNLSNPYDRAKKYGPQERSCRGDRKSIKHGTGCRLPTARNVVRRDNGIAGRTAHRNFSESAHLGFACLAPAQRPSPPSHQVITEISAAIDSARPASPARPCTVGGCSGCGRWLPGDRTRQHGQLHRRFHSAV